MADGGRTSNGRHEAQLVTPFELLRQTSSRESDDLITPFELLRQTAGKSPTRPHKREEPRKLVGLSSLPNPPSPKSSPSGSSSDPPSSPHKADTIVPQLPVHAMLRRKSDPKSPSSPLATSAISIEDAPSPPMSPTSPTKSNDSSRPSSPNNLRLPEPAYLRRVAAERSRKGSRIISFLDTVAPSTPHSATNGTQTTPAMPIQAAGDFLGISRRRTRSMAQAFAPCQWTHGDAAHFAVLSDQFDKFLSRRQVAPPRLVRQRTRTMAFAGVPVLSSTPPGHTRRCSLPLDFGVRAAEPIITSESAPLIAVSSSGGSISSGSASTAAPAAAASPPQSPTSRSKSEKKAKKEKKSRSRKSVDETEESRTRPSSDGASLDRSSSAGVVNPDVFEAADLHSYIVTLLSPHLNSTLQSFRGTLSSRTRALGLL